MNFELVDNLKWLFANAELFGQKNVKMHFIGENPSLTEISTSSLHACKQRGAFCLKNTQKVEISEETDFLRISQKSPFPKKWRQILKIVQSVKLIPYRAFQTQISIHFAFIRSECKQFKMSITWYSWEKNHSRKFYQKPLLIIQKNLQLTDLSD